MAESSQPNTQKATYNKGVPNKQKNKFSKEGTQINQEIKQTIKSNHKHNKI